MVVQLDLLNAIIQCAKLAEWRSMACLSRQPSSLPLVTAWSKFVELGCGKSRYQKVFDGGFGTPTRFSPRFVLEAYHSPSCHANAALEMEKQSPLKNGNEFRRRKLSIAGSPHYQ